MKILLHFFFTVSTFLLLTPKSLAQELPNPENGKTWFYELNNEEISVEWIDDVPSKELSFTILGKIKNDSESEVVYSKSDKTVGILIKSNSLNVKEITYSPENGINFSDYKGSDYPDDTWQCSANHSHDSSPEVVTNSTNNINTPMRRMATPEVDLLVIYTTESKNQKGGKAQMENFINGFIASCNATFTRSKANAKVNLLEARETNYKAHGNLITDFQRLVKKTDGHLDDIHTLRAEIGADLVLLLTDKDNAGTYGYASIPGGQKGNKNSAFSVCRAATAAGVYPHEIGHNFGCNHNIGKPGGTTFPYSYGHFWNNNGVQRGSIMSYIGKRAAYFSNPDVKLDGSPTGRVDLNDNARTIDNLAPYLAAYFDRPNTNTNTGPDGYTYAVDESQTINVTYKVDVAYGANGNWVYLPNQTSDVACTNATFGSDPISGVAKKCYIKEAKGSYALNAILVPGTVELENYDRGGANVSYKDNEAENKGAAQSNFRINDGVDIAVVGSEKAVGWTNTGEWTNYTLNIQEAGTYDLEIHYSSLEGNGEISLLLDNGNLDNNITFPSTGAWATYSTTNSQITLPLGEHILTVKVEENGFNMDKIVFSESAITSINGKASNQLTIFPNPSNDGIFTLSQDAEWSVVNLRGRTIKSGSGKTIDLSSKTKGTYLLKTKNIVQKLVVE